MNPLIKWLQERIAASKEEANSTPHPFAISFSQGQELAYKHCLTKAKELKK